MLLIDSALRCPRGLTQAVVRGGIFRPLGALLVSRGLSSAPATASERHALFPILRHTSHQRQYSTLHNNMSKTRDTADQSAGKMVHSHTLSDSSLEGHSHENSQEHTHDHTHATEHSHSHGYTSLFHSHSHSHQPNELLGKGFMTNPAVRITWIGLFVNVLMAGAKGVGGVYFHSQALMADAIHSISDMVADFLTLATVNVAHKEGSSMKYPLGYGKLETIGAFSVASVLLFAGIGVGWSSLLQILEYLLPAHIYDYILAFQLHSHSHSFGGESHLGHSHSHMDSELMEKSSALPDINAAWLALASIGIKEVLYRKTMKVARESNSKVLVANAWHHRVDSLTAGVAFITVIGGVLFNLAWLDAIGGMLVSILIINAGSGSFKEAWFELIDRGARPGSEHYNTMKLIVQEELTNVSRALNAGFEIMDLSVLTAGARSNMILKLGSKNNLTLDAINRLELDLVSSIKNKDANVGNVLVEFRLLLHAEK